MSGAEQALSTLRDYVERSTHWHEGGADRHAALLALGKLENTQATDHAAVGYLRAVLSKPTTTVSWRQQQDAITEARAWLTGIGVELT